MQDNPSDRTNKHEHDAKKPPAPAWWQRLAPATVIFFLFIFIGAMLVIYFVAM
jgi:hypothetical protein